MTIRLSSLLSAMPVLRSVFSGLLILLVGELAAQHTFSIVAIDPATGEIGSAGATCLDGSFGGGAVIISDIVIGKGAVHTQAYWNTTNQQNARTRVLAGDNATQVISWLTANDAQGNNSIRQYGAVTIGPGGQITADGFTGANTDDYKNHIVGPNYAIQGNILLGQQILDSMESGFLNTQGSLAERLMAAMQGANVKGADTRCLVDSVSSLTSFLRVSRQTDVANTYYLDLQINAPPANGVDPIDALQALFDAWSPPDCAVTIPLSPAPVFVRDTTLTASGNGQTYLVCPGDSLILSGSSSSKVYLLGEGSYCRTTGFSTTNTIYIPAGAEFDGTGSLGSTIFAGAGAYVPAAGSVPIVTICDSVTYVNLSDFPQACETTSSLFQGNHPDAKVAATVREQTLYATWPASGNIVTVELLTLDGKVVRETTTREQSLAIEMGELADGLYLLRVNLGNGEMAMRKIRFQK